MTTKQLLSKRRPGSLAGQNRGRRREVEAELFGTSKGPRDLYQTQQVVRHMREGTAKHPETVVLQAEDINRMRRKSDVRKLDPIQAKLNQLPSDFKSQTLTDRILAIERHRKASLPGSDLDQEAAMLREQTVERAVQLNNQQMDLVKRMNQMLDYAKVATVRERQLANKTATRQSFKSEEKRKDIVMEVERLKAIRVEEEKAQRRKELVLQGKEVLIEQIKERDLQRLKRQEQGERDALTILQAIKAGQEEERKKARAKLEQQNVMNKEILEANNQAILIRLKREEEERLEEQRIAEYNREKERAEVVRQEEARRRREEEEKALQKLREKQEKQSDRQAELDAIRAKRDFQQKERKARRVQKEEREKRAIVQEDLRQGRARQRQEKAARAELEAAAIRQQYERKLREIQDSIAVDKAKEEARKQLVEANQVQVKKQIEMRRLQRRQHAGVDLWKGKQTVIRLGEQKRLLQQIKQQKLLEMEQLGIPQKYRVQLQRLQVK